MKHLLLVIFLSHLPIFGQVNTESLRQTFEQKGHFQEVSLGYYLTEGNSNSFSYKIHYRYDWITDNWNLFLITNFNKGVGNGEAYLERSFFTVRSLRKLTPTFGIETFVQKEQDQFRLLEDRQLLGVGTRMHIFENIALGNGFMVEHEQLDDDEKTQHDDIRSTNYISFKYSQNESLSWSGVSYFQFLPEDASDYRIIGDISLQVNVTETLSLLTSFNYRFDNNPPANVEKQDFSLENKIKFSF